jgi:hypothetical protein
MESWWEFAWEGNRRESQGENLGGGRPGARWSGLKQSSPEVHRKLSYGGPGHLARAQSLAPMWLACSKLSALAKFYSTP